MNNKLQRKREALNRHLSDDVEGDRFVPFEMQQTTSLADVEEDKHSVSPKPNTPLADRASSERQLTGLLPCPFCGYDDVELVATPDDDGAYEVLCQTVGCGGRSGDFYDKGKVIKQWNTRYSDASADDDQPCPDPRCNDTLGAMPIPQCATAVAWAEKADASKELRNALEQSVKLQSHYARLLNMYDGGLRLQFADADEWLARLALISQQETK